MEGGRRGGGRGRRGKEEERGLATAKVLNVAKKRVNMEHTVCHVTGHVTGMSCDWNNTQYVM